MELKSIFLLLTMLMIIGSLTYFIHNKKKKSLRPVTSKQEPRFDPLMQEGGRAELSDEPYDDYSNHYSEPEDHRANMLLDDPLLVPKTNLNKEPEPQIQRKKSTMEEIIYLIVVAKPGKPYVGYELLQSLLTAGLRFGAMDIFHRHEDLHGKGRILFSVASASEPGTFEINKMGAYSGQALMMFLRLSANKDLMSALDTMFETAKQIVEDLGGEVLDQERKALTPERVEILRQKIIDFEQKQHTGDLFDE
jgi:cell division protein ZipA